MAFWFCNRVAADCACANRFMTIEDEFITSLKNNDELSGEITIFAPNTICVYHLPALLTDYRKQHPKVNFILRAHLGTKKALEELRAGAFDLLLVMEEEFNDPDFKIDTLQSEEIIFICHNAHPLAKQKNVKIDTLMNENFILTEPTCGYRSIITREFLKHGKKLDPIMWFDNAEAIKQCIMSNMGISFLPKIAAEGDINCGAFSQIHVDQKFDSQIKLQLVTHKDKWLNPALRHFIAALKQQYGGS